MGWTPTLQNCDDYLNGRTGSYEKRAVRYRKAANWLISSGLDNGSTVCDIGAGWTEFDYCLRTEFNFRGRYIPVDGGIDGTDLNAYTPTREVDFFVCLEIFEHLYSWRMLTRKLQQNCSIGICASTPNPKTTDVLGMDETHVTEVTQEDLEWMGFHVTEEMFYGGVFSNGLSDSLFGTWVR